MVRKYIKKETRSKDVDEDSMQSAINDVIQGRLSYRKAANKYNVKTSTLETRVKKIKSKDGDGGPSTRTFNSKFTSLQVFSLEEERFLKDYVTKCCKIHYVLTTIQFRKLAYEYAKALKLKYPEKWNENKMAGTDWMHGYRKRNPNLRVKESIKRVGSATNEVHRPSLWYYELMTFLDKQQRNANDPLEIDYESRQSEQRRPEGSNLKRKLLNEHVLERKKLKLIDAAQELLERDIKKTNTFAIYVAEQLELMPTYQRQVAEKLIAEVIFLAKTENLNFDSRVETPSRSHTSAIPSGSSSRVLSPQYESYHSPEIIIETPPSPQFQAAPSSPKIQQHPKIVHVSLPSPSHQVVELSEETTPNIENPPGALLKELLISRKQEK